MDGADSSQAAPSQAYQWNAAGGQAWTQMQATLDEMFAPIERFLVDEAVASAPAEDAVVVDIGCGTGATTLAVAEALGARARSVTGVDVSEPMIAMARERAADRGSPARFLCADAATHDFEEAADLITSRFGVMFFDDPVAAFTNLRAATRPGAALRAVVWRDASENPFMIQGEQAAAGLLDLPARPAEGPGQFGMADPARTRAVLETAGWASVDIRAVDFDCSFPEADFERYLGVMGHVGRALAGRPAEDVARVVEAIRPAFDRFVTGGRVTFTAACWVLAAQVPQL